MSLFVDNAIAGWIRNAEKTGELKNNAYNGKKLELDEYFQTPAEHRMSMKILKDANCLPPAIRLMKQIDEVKEAHSNTTDPEKKETLRKEIMSLELKRDLLLESM
ncbi:DnaJ family domain-containing protein [Vibrio gigantis]|uniref:DnaJ family domain-containing protein n=1 Tax=Vibrio crassostreae TaxID=246167 RepID=UPI002E19750F|nr:DUF1992 domain-containing protein [Vibrio crassostreae]